MQCWAHLHGDDLLLCHLCALSLVRQRSAIQALLQQQQQQQQQQQVSIRAPDITQL
jgi:hypothetical protein